MVWEDVKRVNLVGLGPAPPRISELGLNWNPPPFLENLVEAHLTFSLQPSEL